MKYQEGKTIRAIRCYNNRENTITVEKGHGAGSAHNLNTMKMHFKTR